MPTKQIVVLANSVKHNPGRCVAGREVQLQGNGDWLAGAWNRPVSEVGEGELRPEHLRVEGGGALQVLDIAEVRLRKREGDPTQPENWYIDESVPWKKVGKWAVQRLTQLTESPVGLWVELGGRIDRVSEGYLRKHPPEQSLHFLRLTSTKLVRSGYGLRLKFRYERTDYALKVTDPQARGVMSAEKNELDLGTKYVCISLAPAFEGYHYKLVANVIW